METSTRIDGKSIILRTANINTKIEFFAENIIRLRSRVNNDFSHNETLVVVQEKQESRASCIKEDNKTSILNKELRFTAEISPFKFSVFDSKDRLFFSSNEMGLVLNSEGKISGHYNLEENEKIYGLGQGNTGVLNLRDITREIWQQRDTGRFCGSCGSPFLYSTRGYGLLLNSSYPSRFVIGLGKPTPKSKDLQPPPPWGENITPLTASHEKLSIYLEHDDLDVFLIYGPSYEKIISSFAWLTGKSPIFPRWALGLLMSRFGYMNQAELTFIAETFRKKDIPCDAFMLDVNTYKKLGDLKLDEQMWPDPEGMIRVLNSMSFQLIGGQHSFIDKNSLNFKEFYEKNCLITLNQKFDKDNVGNAGIIKVHNYAYDFSNPIAMKEWWAKIQKQFDIGVRGYWTDMSEVMAVYESNDQCMGSRIKMQNLYATTWARTLYEGQRSYSNERLFIMPTSTYAGIQRYGVCNWTNDISPTFEVLNDHVKIGQQNSISGQSYWCTDIGGYENPESYYDPELFIRWLQWGVFCPVMRIHGQHDNEPWLFNKYYEKIIKDTIKLRYELLPYIYTNSFITNKTGMSIVRAMVISYPDDNEAIMNETQYMFGENILVAPIVEKGQHNRKIYLPEGDWYDFNSYQKIEGKKYIDVEVSLSRIPFFIKAGSIIPTMNPQLSAGKADFKNIKVNIFTGKSGKFNLYEDDGQTYKYENGEYITTDLEYDETHQTLTIMKSNGDTESFANFRHYHIIFVGLKNSYEALFDGKKIDPDKILFNPKNNSLEIDLPKIKINETHKIKLSRKISSSRQNKGPSIHQSVDLEPYSEKNIVRIHTFELSEIQANALKLLIEVPLGWRIIDRFFEIKKSGNSFTRIDEIKLALKNNRITQSSYLLIKTAILDLEPLRIPLGTGWITWWKTAGPYEKGLAGFDIPFNPEKNLKINNNIIENGINITKHKNMWFSGFVNLDREYSQPSPFGDISLYTKPMNHRTAYTSCNVFSKVEMDAVIEILADDRAKIWLNNTLVGIVDGNHTRPIFFRVKLNKGNNRVFVKCSQYIPNIWKGLSGRPWGFNFRILDSTYKLADDLTIRL